jgi:hypothetical protein
MRGKYQRSASELTVPLALWTAKAFGQRLFGRVRAQALGRRARLPEVLGQLDEHAP